MILTSALIGIGGTLLVAVLMVLSQKPNVPSATDGLDFTGTLAQEVSQIAEPEAFTARDGAKLAVRSYQSGRKDAPLVVFLHGSAWHGLQFHSLAKKLAGDGVSDVLAPDLRGHGFNPARRGDVDYIGQFEDDLADLIKARAKPGQTVVMAGFSSGGGLVVRFAGGAHGALIDRAILMSPFLKYNAPTMRPNSGGWAHTALRRLVGLSILNTFQIKALNDKPVISFNMPKAVLDGPLGATVTQEYSYRLNTSFAPRSDYLKDVAALPPFLLLAGMQDEAFQAAQFEPVLSEVTDKGRYLLVDGIGHLDLVDHDTTYAALVDYLSQ